MKIDAHQHFWVFDPVRDSWIDETMIAIQRNFLPEDLLPILKENGLDGCVTVQSDQSEQENEFHLSRAGSFEFVKGIVGWVDLQANDITAKLDYYSQFNKMKGFRHVLQGEPDRALMLQPAFMNGIGALEKHGFTYDILIFPDQLKYTREFVAAFPNQRFVIDHIAKPNIKEGLIDDWKKDMLAVAAYDNVHCKISGMVTEADWKNWKYEDFTPYLDAVVEAFGCNRIMYGSDWPVCQVAAPYRQMVGIVKEYFARFSMHEQERFFGLNAMEFYNL